MKDRLQFWVLIAALILGSFAFILNGKVDRLKDQRCNKLIYPTAEQQAACASFDTLELANATAIELFAFSIIECIIIRTTGKLINAHQPAKLWFGWAAIWASVAFVAWSAHFPPGGALTISELPRRPNQFMTVLSFISALGMMLSLSLGLVQLRHGNIEEHV